MGHYSNLTSFTEMSVGVLTKLLNLHKPLGLAIRKHPVSIALSNRIVEKIDKKVSKR